MNNYFKLTEETLFLGDDVEVDADCNEIQAYFSVDHPILSRLGLEVVLYVRCNLDKVTAWPENAINSRFQVDFEDEDLYLSEEEQETIRKIVDDELRRTKGKGLDDILKENEYLSTLSDTGYDVEEIIDSMREEDIPLTLDGIIERIFMQGKEALKAAIEVRIDLRKSSLANSGRDNVSDNVSDEIIEDLDELDPDSDMRYSLDGMDSFCWLEHGDVYRKYLWNEILKIGRNMGFPLHTAKEQ